ncbi:hypothetical protein CspeluHIS016_0101640 [Cutaneotrichosporon spelunceum]|uniref:Ricin B lectin domain-containing protein n=1 Tax=Cutaneotrichosporon spelunceum TaxID=1672016 RepID=A0AAD3TM07_9TREE|nr:hypothetical protein CspeluHIS016_0101640 [Cutaneotrichosporon spelunceum]
MLAIFFTILLSLVVASPVPGPCDVVKRDDEYKGRGSGGSGGQGGHGGHDGGHDHGGQGGGHDHGNHGGHGHDHGSKPCKGGSCPPSNDQNLVFIHPNGNRRKCVDIAGGVLKPGTQVQIFDCNGTPAQRFLLSRGNGQIMVPNTELCLEAIDEWNGGRVTVGRCNRSLRQFWWYTDDNRIAMTDRGLCLDLPGGQTWNRNPLQVWQCGTGNTNQVWTTSFVGVPF